MLRKVELYTYNVDLPSMQARRKSVAVASLKELRPGLRLYHRKFNETPKLKKSPIFVYKTRFEGL